MIFRQCAVPLFLVILLVQGCKVGAVVRRLFEPDDEFRTKGESCRAGFDEAHPLGDASRASPRPTTGHPQLEAMVGGGVGHPVPDGRRDVERHPASRVRIYTSGERNVGLVKES